MTFERSDLVRVGTYPYGPVFRYLKPDSNRPGISWVEIPYTGRVFRMADVLLKAAW